MSCKMPPLFEEFSWVVERTECPDFQEQIPDSLIASNLMKSQVFSNVESSSSYSFRSLYILNLNVWRSFDNIWFQFGKWVNLKLGPASTKKVSS